MNKNSTDKMRTILSILFAFLLFLSVFSVFLCAETSLGLLSGRNLNSSLEKSDYTNQAFHSLEQSLSQEATKHNIPENVLTDTLDSKQFSADLQEGIQAALKGNAVTADTSVMLESMEDSLNSYLKDQEVGDNDKIQTAVDEILQTAESQYQTYTAFPFGNYYFQYHAESSSIIKILLPVSLILAVILSLLLIRLQMHRRLGWYYMGSSLLGASLLNGVAAAAIHFGRNFDLKEAPAYYKSFLNIFFGSGVLAFVITTIIGLLLFTLTMVLGKRAGGIHMNDDSMAKPTAKPEDIQAVASIAHFVDIHTHILPGIDDGAVDGPETMKMIKLAYDEGVRIIVATPHFGKWNPTYDRARAETLMQRLRESVKKVYPDLKLFMGNELYYSPGILEDLHSGRAQTLGKSDYVLVEFSVQEDYKELYKGLNSFITDGYRPILAHAERYECLRKHTEYVKELVDAGVYIQINARSFLGGAFDQKTSWCMELFNSGLVHFLGSDCHNSDTRPPVMKQAVDRLIEKADPEMVKKVIQTNVIKLFQNKYI